jgi:hypothetical protein
MEGEMAEYPADTELLGGLSHAHPQRGQDILPENRSGVRRSPATEGAPRCSAPLRIAAVSEIR